MYDPIGQGRVYPLNIVDLRVYLVRGVVPWEEYGIIHLKNKGRCGVEIEYGRVEKKPYKRNGGSQTI